MKIQPQIQLEHHTKELAVDRIRIKAVPSWSQEIV